MKKLIKILVIAIVVLVLVLGGLFIFSRSSNSPAAETARNILPFGSEDDYQPTSTTSTDPFSSFESVASTTQIGTAGSGLFRIVADPVAGFMAYTKNVSTSSRATFVRYTDRATGHIYDVNPTTVERIKITNTTIPKVYEAHFRADGSKVLYRTLREQSDVVENLSLALSAPRISATSAAEENFYTFTTTLLRGNVGEVVVGNGDTLYFVLEDSAFISSANFDGTSIKTVLSSPFTDWRLSRFGNSLLAWTKASTAAQGYAYSINPTTGALTKLVGPLPGVSVEGDPSGGRLLYSYNSDGQTKLFARSLASGSTDAEIAPVTLAEKCAWSPTTVGLVFCGAPSEALGTNEPDSWYKGISRFSDNIWKFDTETTEGILLSEPKKAVDVDLDVYEPQVSPLGDYLIFINKTDLSLWALKLD